MTIPWTCNDCDASGEVDFTASGGSVSEVLENELWACLSSAHVSVRKKPDCLGFAMTILMPTAPMMSERRGIITGWTA